MPSVPRYRGMLHVQRRWKTKGAKFRIFAVPLHAGYAPGLALAFLICVAGFRYLQSRYLSKATTSADAFHRALSEGQIAQIYADADESFRRSLGSRAAVEQIIDLRQRLADCQHPRPSAWSVSGTSNGVFVVTSYRTRCANGELIETLRWHIVDGSARLASLRVTTRSATINGRRRQERAGCREYADPVRELGRTPAGP